MLSFCRILTGVVLFSFVLPAQQTAERAQPRLTVQGSIRSRLEAWDWFAGEGDNSYAYLGSIARLSLGQTRPGWDWQLEFAAPFLLGLPDSAVAPGSQGFLGLGGNYFTASQRSRNAGMAFVKQGFFRRKHGRHSVRLGRFEFLDGSELAPKNSTLAILKRDRIQQRILGSFGWTHVGRSFDGGHYVYSSPKQNVTLVAALPTRGVFQVDGWGSLDTGFAYLSYNRPVAGRKNAGDLRLFGLYYHDWRRVLKVDNRPLPARQSDRGNIRVGSFGGHYLHALQTQAGIVDVLLWGVGQTGRWGALDHRGVAVALEAGYQPGILPALKPWFRGGYFHGSGDDDPLDSRHRTFFQVLPTPRPFARFPFFCLMNNQDVLATLMIRPHGAVTIAGEFHWLRLTSRRDLWYLGGGAFQPWTFGYIGRPGNGNQALASLYDVSADWRVNAHVSLSGYFGYANGKSVIRAIYPRGKDGRFGYLEFTLRF